MYQVTFKEARYTYWTLVEKQPVHKIIDQESGTPWTFCFKVSLALQDTVLDKLPDAIREKVKKAVINLGDDMFSIQQLLVDLNSAVFDKFMGLKNLPTGVEGYLNTIIKLYLKEQPQNGDLMFGYAVKYTGRSNTPALSFMPTALNFCITPYQVTKGKTPNSDLDTLNYLTMNDHNQPLRVIPNFDFNWVDDAGKNTPNGTVAVRADRIIPFLVKRFNPILKGLCPTVSVDEECYITLQKSGTDRSFKLLPPFGIGKAVANFSYNSKNKHSVSKGTHYTEGNGEYSATCGIFLFKQGSRDPDNGSSFKVSTIRVEGHCMASASYYSCTTFSDPHVRPNIINLKMPKATYHWSVDLPLEMLNSEPGEMAIKVSKSDFTQKPQVSKHDLPAWEKFLASLSGWSKHYVDDLSGMRKQVETDIESHILENLKSSLERTSDFVFPGGKTFIYKEPCFSNSDDLATSLTYVTLSN